MHLGDLVSRVRRCLCLQGRPRLTIDSALRQLFQCHYCRNLTHPPTGWRPRYLTLFQASLFCFRTPHAAALILPRSGDDQARRASACHRECGVGMASPCHHLDDAAIAIG